MMNLTKMIFDYWKIWMSVPVATNEWGLSWDGEGLTYCDGNVATFWYLLNVEWYRMQNKLYARTDCKEPFDPYLRDFDEDYLLENGYK
jgi:hypothetical protein